MKSIFRLPKKTKLNKDFAYRIMNVFSINVNPKSRNMNWQYMKIFHQERSMFWIFFLMKSDFILKKRKNFLKKRNFFLKKSQNFRQKKIFFRKKIQNFRKKNHFILTKIQNIVMEWQERSTFWQSISISVPSIIPECWFWKPFLAAVSRENTPLYMYLVF